MNIISGKYKGAKIIEPKAAKGTHPMGSREKLALINSISPYLEGATVFDVFAGTGALGLEALSRGAKQVIFIESDRSCIDAIKQSIANLSKYTDQKTSEFATLITKKAENVNLKELPTPDIIILDPPYDEFDIAKIAKYATILPPEGLLVLSHPKADIDSLSETLTLISTRKYASCHISIFKK